MSETIFALSSATGKAGVSIIRMSGPESLNVAKKIMRRTEGLKPRFSYYAALKDPETHKIIDRAVVVYFKSPQSFTGEDIVEYHVHGSRAIIKYILDIFTKEPNCRLAEAGEFTKRGFQNGKFDLTEAEAIADLINAETEAQRQQAVLQMDGHLSKIYNDWSDRLKRMLAHQEADIEFPDEDMPEGVSDAISPDLLELIEQISNHLNDNRRGEILRDGISIAILGAPNAGKSSLINTLSMRDVAIVSEQAGTTRDIIEVNLDLAGYPVIISDTAGLRQSTEDEIEKEGINRALKKAKNADIKITLFDISTYPNLDIETKKLIDKNTIIAFNKIDETDLKISETDFPDAVCLSVKTGRGIKDLLYKLEGFIKERYDNKQNEPSLTRQRHRHDLTKALESLHRACTAPLPELVAEDIRLAMRSLGRITGHVDVEDLLDVIFRDFCIGK